MSTAIDSKFAKPAPPPSPVQLFAELLDYPDPFTPARAAAAAQGAMQAGHPSQDGLELFAVWAAGASLPQLEEAYTRAFDLNPATTLEVGWHLFGDTYKRGQFLAYLKRELRERGVDSGNRLPDHLAVLLRLGQTLPAEDALGLSVDCLLPAIDLVQPALGDNPYGALLAALRVWLSPDPAKEPPPRKVLLPILNNEAVSF
jgi:nitrate reductase delta subunit